MRARLGAWNRKICSADTELARKVKDIGVINPIPENIMDEHHKIRPVIFLQAAFALNTALRFSKVFYY
jgi:hypothetical protein